jgi:hypothetical protein
MVSSRRKKPGGQGTNMNTRSQNTRSQIFRTFTSDAREAGALVRELRTHLQTRNKDISEAHWKAWTDELRNITNQITRKQIGAAYALPVLRDIAKKSKFAGAQQKGPRGIWTYSPAVHTAAKEHSEKSQKAASDNPSNRSKTQDKTQEPSSSSEENSRASPNLLATSDEESKPEDTSPAEKTRITEVDTQKAPEEKAKEPDITENPYFMLTIGDFTPSSTNSSPSSSQQDLRRAPRPPNDLPLTQRVPSPAEDSASILKPRTSDADRLSDDESQTSLMQKYIKNINVKIKDAQALIASQAEEQHKAFTLMSRNNMAQYNEKATTMIKSRYKELTDTTANWTTRIESKINKIKSEASAHFESECYGMLKGINREHREEYESYLTRKEEQHAEATNAKEHQVKQAQQSMVEQAQVILDQMPSDLETLKDELEAELRAYGDGVRQDLEDSNQEYKSELQTITKTSPPDPKNIEAPAHTNATMLEIEEAIRQAINRFGREYLNRQLVGQIQDTCSSVKTELLMIINNHQSSSIKNQQETVDTSMRLALAEVEHATLVERTTKYEQDFRSQAGRMLELQKFNRSQESRLQEAEQVNRTQAIQMIEIARVNRSQASQMLEIEQTNSAQASRMQEERLLNLETTTIEITQAIRDSKDREETLKTRITQLENTVEEQETLKTRIDQLENTVQEQDRELTELTRELTEPTRSPTEPQATSGSSARVATPERSDRPIRPTMTSPPPRRVRYQDEVEQEEEEEINSPPAAPRGNRWNINPESIHSRRNNQETTARQERTWNNRSEARRENPRASQPRDHRTQEATWDDADDEPTSIEQSKMESAIRAFEKKRDIEELPERPTHTQIAAFYNSLAHSANSSGIPMRPINSIQKCKPIYPEKSERQLHPQVLSRFSSTLYYRLHQLIPETVHMYHDLVIQNQRDEDGYTAIYQVLSATLPVLQDFRPKWGPAFPKKQSIYRFVNTMQTFTDQEHNFGRPYSEFELVTNIIQHAIEDARYEITATSAKAMIQNSMNNTGPEEARATVLPPELAMKRIAQTLDSPNKTRRPANNQQSDLEDTPRLNKFEHKPRPLDPKKQVQCRACQAWGHDGTCYMMCKFIHIQKYIKEHPEEAARQADHFVTTNSKRMVKLLKVDDEEAQQEGIDSMMIAFQEEDDEEQQEDDTEAVVRKAHANVPWNEFAHEFATEASALQPFAMAPEYYDARILPKMDQPQQEEGVQLNKMRINIPTDATRQLRFTHQADGGANFAATDRLDLLHDYKVYEDPLPITAFFNNETESPQQHSAIGEGILKLIGDAGEVIPMRMLYTPNSTGTVISPERTMKDMQKFNPKNKIVNWSQNGGDNRSVQWKDKEGRVVSELQMEERNGLYYIKNATLLPPKITPTVKAVRTIESIQEGTTEEEAESPNTDTVKDHEARTQEPTGDGPSNDVETIYAEKLKPTYSQPQKKKGYTEVETVNEKEAPKVNSTSAEYMEANSTFMEPIDDPKSIPPDDPSINSVTREKSQHPPPTPPPPPDKSREATQDNDESTNHQATDESATSAPAPKPSPSTSIRTKSWTSGLTKGIQLLEIWHQRMGHPSPSVLQRTQKVVEGIPKLPDASPIFHCRMCDKAKQHKAARGTTEHNDAYLPGTMFHMDLGFFRGPANLVEVVRDGAVPSSTTIIKSIEGYTSYLSIIDAATRFLWVFPLKNKHPPIELIDKFLSRYGNKHPHRTISTDPTGQLAQSQMFKHMCDRNGFEFSARAEETTPTMEDLLASLPEQRRVIRTDGGMEFAGSQDFRSTCNSHDYDVQVTGPDTSSQNGKGERPHRTLAEKTKCLLYTGTMGVEFWCSAIVYACFLYNRTFHSAIDQTPYEAFTGLKPNCSHILTYGCTITAKKPSGRPTKADPNTYEGIFLGFGATSKNLKYHDIHSQRRKWAHHVTMDEFQYGDDPKDRSTASKHILETFTKLPHHQVGGKKLLQPIKPILVDPISVGAYPNPIDLQLDPLPYTAAAAKFERPAGQDLNKALEQYSISLDDSGPLISEKVLLKGTHPLLGMGVLVDKDNPNRLYLQNCTPSTPMANIPRWRSRFRGAHIRSINEIPVHSIQDIRSIIREQRQKRKPNITIQMAKPLAPSMADHGVPQLHLDQLNVIAHHLDAIKNKRTESWPGLPTDMPPLEDEDIAAAIHKGLAIPRMTRRTVLKTPEAEKWKTSEWTQLSKYQNQGMFGEPCERPNDPNAVILPFVWTYLHKLAHKGDAIVEKARATCNGGKRHGKAVTIAETYAACVEQPAQRLYWALVASLNLTAIGCDVGNAFAEAPAPSQPFYMYIDEQFRDWWENCLGREPIPRGYVLKVNKALQGHPEAPRLWHKHIDKILIQELGFTATTHETCLYHKKIDGDIILLLRQVDDFSIASTNPAHCEKVRQDIESRMQNPLNDLGVIKRFNGIDILQTRDFVKISCETYIDKIVSHHNWQHEVASNQPIPMRADSESLRKLELSKGPEDPVEAQALETEMGFSYRQAIGELIFAMTVGRIDISYPIIKLSQYSAQPSKAHYQALKQIFVYLNATRDNGLIYWRTEPNPNMPYVEPPTPVSAPSALQGFPETHEANLLHGYVDSDWGSDRQHRRSISGIVFMLAGAAIFYKTRYQPTVALSSTEAEFAAAADSGKAALYLRSILQELGVEQLLPTVIYEDNNGARLMTNAQQPTRRTRHVELKQFAVLQWVEDEQIIFGDIGTANNISDSLTKQTGRIKFYQHHDILMGRLRPAYARTPSPEQPIISKCSISTCDYFKIIDYSDHDIATVTSMGR